MGRSIGHADPPALEKLDRGGKIRDREGENVAASSPWALPPQRLLEHQHRGPNSKPRGTWEAIVCGQPPQHWKAESALVEGDCPLHVRDPKGHMMDG
jgi:hypothetical protein